MPTIHVFNGPNLNLLGQREPDIYGLDTLAGIESRCRGIATAAGIDLDFRQTNHEGQMVDWLQEVRLLSSGLAINPAAFTYAGYAVVDALRMLECPVIEVHLSNIHRREAAWRAQSIITQVVTGVISGLGAAGYELAVRHLVAAAEKRR
jgi:3-dehydroquinate dehydratase II